MRFCATVKISLGASVAAAAARDVGTVVGSLFRELEQPTQHEKRHPLKISHTFRAKPQSNWGIFASLGWTAVFSSIRCVQRPCDMTGFEHSCETA
ncbi:uncharacterized protein BDZ83DRAFT_183938 [Colletotrichum acutatum]|uniref:Secreted protein n=1 Tax=Glomerella acutata TaxID=27357 RepID=A0AAD8X848_GLOAC|nr:uncharacterized protein BDZ83DRAFT_183938 [Colletotrichum acutatum]KAK1707121.1 hypothetical protein BDZ83DRAFT_183938 [Colletotrichum acutatum]